jgi:tRNA(fMet)-specific endonuclease VapC
VYHLQQFNALEDIYHERNNHKARTAQSYTKKYNHKSRLRTVITFPLGAQIGVVSTSLARQTHKGNKSKVIYMLDTNVLMHFANDERKSYKILKHLNGLERKQVLISSITVHEVHVKLIKSKVAKAQVDRLAEVMASLKVVNFGTGAAVQSAKVRCIIEANGETMSARDILIAGHALFENATFVTNNTGEYSRVHGLKVEDWIS